MARIHKVTRRRRLTVPSPTGPEALDANVVACYLDNELPADQVADYEKRCLTSDVHLAEVASCHQILSMIGQRAKVPPEVRMRMYRLVKGREAMGRASREHAPSPVAESAPIEPWTAAPTRQRSALERRALPIGVIALIALMGVSAWTLAPSGREAGLHSRGRTQTGAQPQQAGPLAGPEAAKHEPDAAKNPAEPKAPEETADPAMTPEEDTTETAPAKPETGAVGGSSGTLITNDGIALRWNTESRLWTRVADKEAIHKDERIVCLAPFRTAVQVGEIRLDLVGPTEIRLQPASAGEAARFALDQGQVVLRSGVEGQSVAVVVGNKPWTVALSPGSPVGVELLDLWRPGQPAPIVPTLKAYVVQGDAQFRAARRRRR